MNTLPRRALDRLEPDASSPPGGAGSRSGPASADGPGQDPARYYRPDPRHPERIRPATTEGDDEVADLTAAAMHGALRAFIEDVHYPCVGAKSAVHAGSYRLGVYRELGAEADTAALARDLATFTETADGIDGDFATFIAIFEGPRPLELEKFEMLLWKQLQALHDIDGAEWDRSVSDDPESHDFSFSFGGTAFFVVGLCPESERLSRRFPWPTLVFNPHEQFERLRASDRWDRMQEVIRRKDVALQGAINPVLEDFGAESEARQYSGRSVEEEWRAPFEVRSTPPTGCPFHSAKKNAGGDRD